MTNMPGSAVIPRLAPVRPRVYSLETGDTRPLDAVVAELLEQREYPIIHLRGGAGTGKTVALAHLAAMPWLGQPIEFVDDASGVAGFHRVICASRGQLQYAGVSLCLAPWTRDEWIEYLLAVRPDHCAAALGCMEADPDTKALAGNPALCSLVLDALVADAPLSTVRAVIERELDVALRSRKERRLAGVFCLSILRGKTAEAEGPLLKLARSDEDYRRFRPLRHPFVQKIMAGERLARWIASGVECPALRKKLPPALIDELARRVLAQPDLGLRVDALYKSAQRVIRPQAATILLAAYPKWRPADNEPAHLAGGSFPHAAWSGLRLPLSESGGSDLSEADLTQADLSGAVLDGALLRGAKLAGARLDKASLVGVNGSQADWSGARLIAANADRLNLRRATLCGAILDDASLIGVDFEEADLRGARFRSANLIYSMLPGCQVVNADFRDANLSGCFLRGIVLREAELAQARFREADLSRCDLEGVELESPDFHKAKLCQALLTGSKMPHADFRDADLSQARLADIHWENADLRGADLRGCTFHMGSTRSGLVGSPYPGHGSKTGFYTDDYYDQDYKAPEEIRKANLCGADLRGAVLDDVDFYLVDLRGAMFDRDAAMHLSRCGAILVDRCS